MFNGPANIVYILQLAIMHMPEIPLHFLFPLSVTSVLLSYLGPVGSLFLSKGRVISNVNRAPIGGVVVSKLASQPSGC